VFDSKLDLQLARIHKELAMTDMDSARQKRRGMDAHLSTVDRRLEVGSSICACVHVYMCVHVSSQLCRAHGFAEAQYPSPTGTPHSFPVP
jgi:hypothetical protein